MALTIPGEDVEEVKMPGDVKWREGFNVLVKAVPLHAMVALGERGDMAHTHSRPRH
jgi:hypothetical protein